MRKFLLIYLIFSISVMAVPQESSPQENTEEAVPDEDNVQADVSEPPIEISRLARGSIPEELLRPARGEAPHYPIDTVIGELGRGQASAEAYTFANSIAEGLLLGDMSHSSLSTIDSSYRERHLSALNVINPGNFRLGGGREEADGAVSFFIRFIGRNQGITGEMYIRYVSRENADGIVTSSNWVFEELLLEEAKTRDIEQQESIYRIDFNPYERFF